MKKKPSERRRTKVVRRSEDERYRALFEKSPIGIVLIDAETGKILESNETAHAQLGYTREEMCALSISDFEALKKPEETRGRMRKVLSEGSDDFETIQRAKNGDLRNVHVWTKKISWNGRDCFYTVFQDITDRAEKALRRSWDLIEMTERTTDTGGWELDLETQAVTWSAQLYRILEADPAVRPGLGEAIGYYAPEARPAITAALKAAADFGTPWDLELPLVTARGRRIWARVKGAAERRDGRSIRLYGALQDITARKAGDDARRLQSAALNAAANAIVITDSNGDIEWVNPAFTSLTGYTAAEVIGKNPRALKSGAHDRAFYEALWNTILSGGIWRGEIVNRRKDGGLYTEHMTITPVANAAGAVANFIAVKEDITERLQLQAQFLQAQKMEAVGRLAGGVAHDFNNLLTAISGYCELLLKSLPLDDPNRLDVEEIGKAGQRAAGLTRQLLAFSRKQVLQPRSLDVNEVLRELEKMLRRLIGEDVELVFELDGGLGTVKADPGQIEQVVMNLAVNSRDAMPKGGRITIKTKNVLIGPGDAAAYYELSPGPYALLSVSDNGSGMDSATLARVFEPFFTTKEPGIGTGLGLATVHGIVKQSGGGVFVDSELGRGTDFKIYLPAIGEPVQALKASPSSGTPAGQETVLLVDDDEMVRKFASRVLRQAGYTVLPAKDAKEALAACALAGASIRLLLTDVVMPQMRGPELAARVRALVPGVKVVFMSGYTEEGVVRSELLASGAMFLQKPIGLEQLTRKVREALDAPGPRP